MPDTIVTINILQSEFEYIIKKLREKAEEDCYPNDLYLHNIVDKMEESKRFNEARKTGYR